MAMNAMEYPRHPMGCKARVLLTSVFGPYAQDDGVGKDRAHSVA